MSPSGSDRPVKPAKHPRPADSGSSAATAGRAVGSGESPAQSDPRGPSRKARSSRSTLETDVSVQLDIDAWRFSGAEADFEPVGLGFFGHMLRTLTVYAGWSLHLDYSFDGHVDLHHGVEDIGIVLGQALAECLYESAEHRRFGSALAPMDDSLAEAVVDAGKRPYLHFAVDWPQPTIGSFDLCLTEEFFRALALNAGLTLHLSGRYGRNSHHLCEALFKAVGLALREALSPGAIKGPFSIKGVL